MLNQKRDFILKLWDDYSHFKENDFNIDFNDFKNLSSRFNIGESYYYVFDLKFFKILYCSDDFIKIHPTEKKPIFLKDCLNMIHPNDIIYMNFSESWGLEQILNKAERNSFKLGYLIRIKISDKNYDLFYHQTYYEFSERGKVKYCIHFITRFRHLIATINYTAFILNTKDNSIVCKNHFELSINVVYNSLTNREVEILSLLAKGFCDKEIADFLHISFNTVRTHHKNLNKKIGANNPSDLMRITRKIGL